MDELTCQGTRVLERAGVVGLFSFGEKCEKKKTLDLALSEKLPKELRTEHQEENLDPNHRELECQRSAPQSVSKYRVLGENLEDLHNFHDHLECERSAPHTTNSVLGENLVHDEELECQLSA